MGCWAGTICQDQPGPEASGKAGEEAEATGSPPVVCLSPSLLGTQVFNDTELRPQASPGGLGCNPVP